MGLISVNVLCWCGPTGLDKTFSQSLIRMPIQSPKTKFWCQNSLLPSFPPPCALSLSLLKLRGQTARRPKTKTVLKATRSHQALAWLVERHKHRDRVIRPVDRAFPQTTINSEPEGKTLWEKKKKKSSCIFKERKLQIFHQPNMQYVSSTNWRLLNCLHLTPQITQTHGYKRKQELKKKN